MFDKSIFTNLSKVGLMNQSHTSRTFCKNKQVGLMNQAPTKQTGGFDGSIPYINLLQKQKGGLDESSPYIKS
jgi:hypothetical protein